MLLRGTTATNYLALKRCTNVSYIVGHEGVSSFVSVYRVYSENNDIFDMNMRIIIHYLNKRCKTDYLCVIFVRDGVKYRPQRVIQGKK
jgi:hypothetical protein